MILLRFQVVLAGAAAAGRSSSTTPLPCAKKLLVPFMLSLTRLRAGGEHGGPCPRVQGPSH